MSRPTARTYAKAFFFALGAVFAIAVLGAVRDFRLDFEGSRNDTRCLLRELHDHRQNAYEADRRQSEGLEVGHDDLPPPPTLPEGPEWDKACDGILGISE